MARLLLIFSVLALESFDPASGIDQLLLAGEEWMALGAYVQVDLGLRRSGAERLSAGAGDNRVDVVRVDTVSHKLPL
jgi:hypothetical protein